MELSYISEGYSQLCDIVSFFTKLLTLAILFSKGAGES